MWNENWNEKSSVFPVSPYDLFEFLSLNSFEKWWQIARTSDLRVNLSAVKSRNN